MFYESLHKRMEKHSWSVALFSVDAVCGLVSGALSKLLVYPLDTIKRRMQLKVVRCSFSDQLHAQSELHHQQFRSIGECIRWSLQHERWWGLYKGLTPTVLKASLSSSIIFSTQGVSAAPSSSRAVLFLSV